MTGNQDHAERVTTAILQTIRAGLHDWCCGHPVNFADIRAAIVAVLHDEFAAAEQDVRAEYLP
jgi:hypothetical protein